MTARASDSMFYPLTMCALQIVFMIMIMIYFLCRWHGRLPFMVRPRLWSPSPYMQSSLSMTACSAICKVWLVSGECLVMPPAQMVRVNVLLERQSVKISVSHG